jgi:hypothetical protein
MPTPSTNRLPYMGDAPITDGGAAIHSGTRRVGANPWFVNVCGRYRDNKCTQTGDCGRTTRRYARFTPIVDCYVATHAASTGHTGHRGDDRETATTATTATAVNVMPLGAHPGRDQGVPQVALTTWGTHRSRGRGGLAAEGGGDLGDQGRCGVLEEEVAAGQ